MNKLALLFPVLLACSAQERNFSVCEDQNNAPAACSQMCDPSGANSCPGGFHCSSGGTCDAECTATGNECGDGHTCSNDGECVVGDGCPAVHFSPTKATPAIELVLDRSGSMLGTDIAPSRYEALHTGLTGAAGAVTKSQASVYFGAAMYAGDQSPCLTITGFTVPRAMNNASAIDALIAAKPPVMNGSTPTADAITKVTADFAATPPPAGTTPVILLATDGEPNSCGGGGGTGPSLNAIKAAYMAGIRTYVVGLAGLNTAYLQDVANAGTGQQTGKQPGCTGCSPFYTADNPTSLVDGFNTIVSTVLSCDLIISGMVDPANASTGNVTLDGSPLVYGTDWTVDQNGTTLHILGSACAKLKTSPTSKVDATFGCGSIIL